MFGKRRESRATSEKTNIVNVLDALKRNEIKINICDSNDDIAPNASKIGGNPFLPANFAWPYYDGENFDGETGNRPLSFLAQIDLGSIKLFDAEDILPPKGMIYFFYEMETQKWGFDPKDKGCARVFYFEDTDGFAPLHFPEDLNEEYRIKELALGFSRGISYPGYEELPLHSDLKIEFEEYEGATEKVGAETSSERSKLLGYGDSIQGEMLTECERVNRGIYCGDAEYYKNATPAEKAEINKAATDWILLFQLASVWRDDFELMWGDCGNLYFYIKKQDMAERNFDNIWLVLQCG